MAAKKSTGKFNSIEAVLRDIARGQMVVVVDDADRENEGVDRVVPARSVARSAPRVGGRARLAGASSLGGGASTSEAGASTGEAGASTGEAGAEEKGRIAAATFRALARARSRFMATSARASAGRRFARGRRIARM